jgi:hypothetical protein
LPSMVYNLLLICDTSDIIPTNVLSKNFYSHVFLAQRDFIVIVPCMHVLYCCKFHSHITLSYPPSLPLFILKF